MLSPYAFIPDIRRGLSIFRKHPRTDSGRLLKRRQRLLVFPQRAQRPAQPQPHPRRRVLLLRKLLVQFRRPLPVLRLPGRVGLLPQANPPTLSRPPQSSPVRSVGAHPSSQPSRRRHFRPNRHKIQTPAPKSRPPNSHWFSPYAVTGNLVVLDGAFFKGKHAWAGKSS